MFIAALFTVVKTWKYLQCPSANEWINKMGHTYIKEYFSVCCAWSLNQVQIFLTTGTTCLSEQYSATQKNKRAFAATQMDREIIILSEVSQKEKNKYYIIAFTCRITNIMQMNLSKKQTQAHRHRAQIVVTKNGGRNGLESGITSCKLLYIEQISNKVLLYSTRIYIHYPVINHNGKEYKNNVYITESLGYTAEINTSLVNYTSVKKFKSQRMQFDH